MPTAILPPLFLPPLHNGTFTWDELLCTVLVAIILIIGALVALRFEKDVKEETLTSETERPPQE